MILTKPYRQVPGYCGPASLKIILEHYGLQKTEQELAVLSGATPELGVQAEGIVKACRILGFSAEVKDYAEFLDIEEYIKKGILLMVQWWLEDDGHWSVVVDIDSENIYLQDPHLGMMRAFQRKTFYHLWFDFYEGKISKEQLLIRRMIIINKK